MVWRGDYVAKHIRARAQKGLIEAGRLALAHCQEITPVDTGRLRDSLRILVDTRGLKVSIGSDVPYSKYVEFGTSRMAPRAMIRRTLDEFGPTFTDIIIAAMGE
jgi:HK97 gp10 family phage protein